MRIYEDFIKVRDHFGLCVPKLPGPSGNGVLYTAKSYLKPKDESRLEELLK